MSEKTKIDWCDHTYNPWWGCTKVSPACDNCYAEAQANRFGKWFGDNPRRMFGDKHWAEPLKWNRKAEAAGVRASVFCGSMCDVFEDLDELQEPRERLWDLILDTPSLDWLLLTKRPENIGHLIHHPALSSHPAHYGWDLNNIFLGVTAESQYPFNGRVQLLAKWSRVKLFLSMEPLLGPVDLSEHIDRLAGVIVGGESGPGARPMDPDWARSIRDQCAAARVPFFMKQMSGRTPKEREAIPEDLNIKELPWRKDKEK